MEILYVDVTGLGTVQSYKCPFGFSREDIAVHFVPGTDIVNCHDYVQVSLSQYITSDIMRLAFQS